jgi:hypothetical protein
LIAGLLTLGIQSQAEAAVQLSVHICQGLTCVDFGPSAGPGPFVNSNVVVGDFAISGSVASLEDAALSNAATTTISVRRTSVANDRRVKGNRVQRRSSASMPLAAASEQCDVREKALFSASRLFKSL